MIQNSRCYLCGSSDIQPVPGEVRDNKKLKVLRCGSCGLVFLSSFSHITRSFYEDSKMHGAAPDIDIDAWMKETAEDDDRRYAQFGKLVRNRSVLDFGCGTGGFLIRAAKTAARTTGVEIEARLAGHFKKNGIKVFTDIGRVKERFDVITLFHVLEHFADPVGILKQIAKKIKKDGQIIIEVPNANDALLTLYKNAPFSRFTYWSCHLFLFTERTLASAAEKAGLKINVIRQFQRYPLSNHLYWLSQGKPGGHKQWHYLDSKPLHAAYQKSLASQKCCDTLIGSFSVK